MIEEGLNLRKCQANDAVATISCRQRIVNNGRVRVNLSLPFVRTAEMNRALCANSRFNGQVQGVCAV